jgi:hypothetical protein
MNPVYLHWADAEPTLENWAQLNTRGIAEWSDAVPVLFLWLIGPTPRRCVWPAYGDGPQPPALICPWDEAVGRLQAVWVRLQRPEHAHDGAALRQSLKGVLEAFADTQTGYLVLDASMLMHAEHGCRYDKPGYRKAFEQLRSQATLLAVEWADETQTTPALQRLLAQPVTSVGYWGAEVAAGCWYDWSQVPDDLPNFLAEYSGSWYDDGRSAAEYDTKLGAYLVRRCQPGQPHQEGAVTAYGRWLVPVGPHRVLTNRYDDDAKRAWITLLRPGDSSNDDRYGLLDSNGVEVLPTIFTHVSTVGDRLVLCQAPDSPRGADGEAACELRRIDTGEIIERHLGGRFFHGRGDGYIEAELADIDGPNRMALLDFDGRRLTDFAFSGFSTFHKRHKVAMASRDGRWGLINAQGEVILPMVYDRMSTKNRSGPPHFHGDRVLIFTVEHDAQGKAIHGSDRVGIADKHGRVIVPPTMQPWHLQWAFDKNGCMLVHQNDLLYHLYADGSLSAPLGSRQAALDEVMRQFNQRWQRGEPAEASTPVAEVDREACRELIGLLCRGMDDTAATLQSHLDDWLDEVAAGSGDEDGVAADDEDGPSSFQLMPDDGPATPFFRAIAYALRDHSVWMHLDWKAADEVAHAAAHLPDIAALRTFRWDGLANGEDMQDGFDALAAHLRMAGWSLISFDTQADDYLIGAVAEVDTARCLALAQALRVPIRLVSEPDA